MAKFYLTYNQQARLYGWLRQNEQECKAVTGQNPTESISKLISEGPIGPLPCAHADFSSKVQWWIDRHCPYPFVKSKEKKRDVVLSIKDWIHGKTKKS